MNLELKVLKYLFEGNQIGGIRFGPIPQLLIDLGDNSKHNIHGQIYINMSSDWNIYESSNDFPKIETDLFELDGVEEYHKLINIRNLQINKVELGIEFPHMILYLESGKIFFLSGFDQNHEPWQAGVALGKEDEYFYIVACPGNEYAVWCPENFNFDKSSPGKS